MTSPQKDYQFGNRIVCDRCGVPKEPKHFEGKSILCRGCVVVADRVHRMTVTPEDDFTDTYGKHLAELRSGYENQTVPGVQKAIRILGESPQETMAKIVVELMDPSKGNVAIDPQVAAALPRDDKLIHSILKTIQDAQMVADKQMADAGNPYADMSSEDLRAMMLKGATDHALLDIQLRFSLIRSFIEKCPTFLDEVMQVAHEMEAIPA